MANQRQRQDRRRATAAPTAFDEARDELFQHIMRCGVIDAAAEHQAEWFAETLVYLGERYPELGDTQLAELRLLAERFVQPPKSAAADDPASAA